MKCKHCYAPIRSSSDICEYCGTPIKIKKDNYKPVPKSKYKDDIYEQMRNYKGSTKYQNMMRGKPSNSKQATSEQKSSENFGCLQTIFEFIIYAVILSIFPSSFENVIVCILLIYWGYRFLNFIRNKLK